MSDARTDAARADTGMGGADNEQHRTIRRIFAVLRVVAGEHGAGLRLTEIAGRAGLHPATTRRTLLGLAEERAVVFDPYSHTWHFGCDFLPAQEETAEARLKQRCAGALQRIARASGDTVFLLTRDGLDTRYIDIARGTFPADPLPLAHAGERRPLGVGAGGVVLLAALPAPERSLAIDTNSARFPSYRTSAAEVGRRLKACLASGFASARDTMVAGLSSVSVPVRNERGSIVAALSLLTTNERMSADHLQRSVEWMQRELERT
ncbi:MAG: IclR family transcriptional regulator C-terminal domain-containing protein [Rubrivivax sp.]